MSAFAKLTVRDVAILGARRALRAAIRMWEPPVLPSEEERVLEYTMRTYVLCSGALVEEEAP